MREATLTYRGVKTTVRIEDSDDHDDYVNVSLTVEGKRIANRRTDGTAYAPSYTATVKAVPKS